MVCNTAVFYDIENLIGLFSTKNNTILQLDEIYRRILETEGVSGVSVQKAYTDWGVQINRNLRNYVLQIGIEPVQIFNTNQNDKVKNASDVSLIIDAVELIQKRPDIENYVIVSGDGIFAFLAKKLHEYGKRVIGVGFLRNSNVIFRNACDYYISLEKDDKSLTATTNKSTLKGHSAVSQAAEQTAVQTLAQASSSQPQASLLASPSVPLLAAPLALPSASPLASPDAVKEQKIEDNKVPVRRQGKLPVAFPKSKFTEILVKSDFPVWYKQNGEQNSNGGLLAIRDLINTLFNNASDPAVDLEISVFKTYVDYYVPGFKVSQYKYKRFGEFMRFIVTGSPYCLFMHDGTILRMARRGAVGGRGQLMDDCKGLVITLSDGQKLKSVFDVPAGSSFTFNVTEQVKAMKLKHKSAAGQAVSAQKPEHILIELPAAEKPAESAVEPADAQALKAEHQTDGEPKAAADEGGEGSSVRKTVKSTFMKLMLDGKLSAAECRRLATQEYSHKTFGVKAPILREVITRANLQEQRLINGKVRYWKEIFKFNDRSYLVFKEWSSAIHKDRFVAWAKLHE